MMTMNELLNLIEQAKDIDHLKSLIREWRANRPSFEGGGGANRLLRREREAAP
jgi:hypothetical protein